MKPIQRATRLVAATAALAVATAPGFAQDAKSEISIAAGQADLASQANDLPGVKEHLHQALNCIEGPYGADYSRTAANPCANAGMGAIPDSDDPTTSATLERAISEARLGLGARALASAQGAASEMAATLKSIR